MPEAVIVSAVRTPIATARKGSLADTSAETLAKVVLEAAVARWQSWRIGRQTSAIGSAPSAATRLAAGSTTPTDEFSTGIRAHPHAPVFSALMAASKLS